MKNEHKKEKQDPRRVSRALIEVIVKEEEKRKAQDMRLEPVVEE